MATPTANDPIEIAFLKASQDFKAKLKNQDLYDKILQTRSIDEVYDATDALQREQAKNGRLRHLSKIQPFLERLRDYSGALDTFVQLKPDILSLIWGPIKLIIQWASVLKKSLDAIIDTTSQIGSLLPEFKEVVKMFGHNACLKDVLVLFFRDILDFYCVALDFFSMPRWRYVFEALWPSRREKISIIVQHVERNTSLMRNEVRLEHIREEHVARLTALDHFETTKTIHLQLEYQTIETRIRPIFYHSRLGHINSQMCQGTHKWLLQDEAFVKWLNPTGTSTRSLWIQGIPGAGKTFSAAAAIDQALRNGHTIYAFLSHDSVQSTTALCIFHSLIFQISSCDDKLRELLCRSSQAGFQFRFDEAAKMLADLLKAAGPTYIIIDGVDEIGEMERGRLLRGLFDLDDACSETKFLISSRPELDIKSMLASLAVITVNERNAGSIQAYVTHRSRKWFNSQNFNSDQRAEIESLLIPVSHKAKGMFLYVKVLFDMIRYLTDVRDILDELKSLPENLDEAYERVLARVNSLPSEIARKRARNILGWIGCSPKPLSIRELEQALEVDTPYGDNGSKRSSSIGTLNVVDLCGPIIEVVDEYVHFVHFTVVEYMFSTHRNVAGRITRRDAALSLAICCINYLRQGHDSFVHDKVESGIIAGKYRLHSYASTMWIRLVESYLKLNLSDAVSTQLTDALECFFSETSSDEYSLVNETSDQPDPTTLYPALQSLRTVSLDLHIGLCRAAYFHQQWTGSDFTFRNSDKWVNLDPLTTSQVSISIYTNFEQILCETEAHSVDCHCSRLKLSYGPRMFKCPFLDCFRCRHGFPTRSARDSHIKYHDIPWICSFPGCDYERIGFLSKRMRDDHFKRFHKEQNKPTYTQPKSANPDPDEIQPLLFDVIASNNVQELKALLPRCKHIDWTVQVEMLKVCASSGSAEMMGIIWPISVETRNILLGMEIGFDVLESCLRSRNMEVLRWYCKERQDDLLVSPLAGFRNLYSTEGKFKRHIRLLLTILELDSELEDVFQECGSILARAIHPTAMLDRGVIKAAGIWSEREKFLASLWSARNNLRAYEFQLCIKAKWVLGCTALAGSIFLVKALLGYGVSADDMRPNNTYTPLRILLLEPPSQKNANMARFLLYRGADPLGKKSKNMPEIENLDGARGIREWLGLSWNELVQKVELDRKNGVCPPEYL
ncbi:hypothetical protein B0T17DRAFT_607368 [Bombardia bombarda]|uniref:NACHT domain-containing protein n=1 Tax=Bombardia bombarda TaxID=252184 RepID=A0AA40CAM6_9PEZI|nr:hypothetical protein B0T17DRAFT_607368 [Bombardia bombarda]